jgi:hypothetical protein
MVIVATICGKLFVLLRLFSKCKCDVLAW